MNTVNAPSVSVDKSTMGSILDMKKFYARFLFFILACFSTTLSFASHIVGGALSYTYAGTGTTYTVSLKLYRDCSGIAFPASTVVTVYKANGTLFSPSLNFTLPGGAITNIPPVLPPCASAPSTTPCVEERIYTATVSIPATPGGVYLYYGTNARNSAAVNLVNPTALGEAFYAFIPMYRSQWVEDFTLTNGTTVDNGSTAWSISNGTTAPTSAQVNAGEFEIVGSNNGMVVWASQTISIASFTNGVNLSVNAERAGSNFGTNDSLKIFYSVNGGAKTLFPTNGSLVSTWTSPVLATATNVVGTSLQIFIRAKFNNNNNSTGKTFYADMVSVYDNTFLPNSNPSFSNLPPLLFCSTNSFSFSQAATDIDGDSLVYSMYTPYTDSPLPTFPNNLISVPTVTWVAGYSASSPFNSGGPSVTLNFSTGIMTGVQNANGSRVFGVKCSEYRNAILLSETFRDYEVTAVTCPPFIPSAPGVTANSPLCVNSTLSLTATFTSGATYNWSGPNSFTSNAQNPSFVATTTAATGNYSCSVTVAGCTGPPGTVAVTANPIPSSPTISVNGPLCTGNTMSLTAVTTSGATYSWIGPNSFTSAVQNPTLSNVTLAAAGTYSATQTVSACVSPNSTVNLVVNSTPATPSPGSNSPLCSGQTLNLSNAFVSGATYVWTGPNSFTSNAQNPPGLVTTTASAGNYSVVNTVAGCPSAAGTVSVTVNPIPSAPVAGSNGPLCAGQTLSLTSTFTSGVLYSWSGPNSFTSSLQNPTIPSASTLATGMYTVNASLAGCPGPVSTVSVTVNAIPPAPVVGGNSPLCSGSTVSLTASTISGATYSWSGPNSFVSTVQNPTIVAATAAANGVYSVAATVSGCAGPTAVYTVNVSDPPAAPGTTVNSPLCAGQTLSLAASFTTGYIYTWLGPNSFSATGLNANISNITVAGAGIYTVYATTALGCSGPMSTVAVVVNPVPSAPLAGNNSPICVGQNLAFTASGSSGTFLWNGPNSFTSALQNPTITGAGTLAAGVYSVSNTVLGCTSAQNTVNAVVNANPSAPGASANSPICAGQNISFTATATGTSFLWTGPNSFTSAVQNPVLSAASLAAGGTYSVTQTLLGCTGPFGTVAVVVNPIPSAPTISSNAPLCANLTLSLSAVPGGMTYSWTGPNSFTSNLQNPTITASAATAGTYSLNVSSLGCVSPQSTHTVVVNPTPAAPTITGNSTLCAGSTVSLTANPGGASYLWNGPNSFTSNAQNIVIAGASTLATGMYSVTATVAGCTSLPGTYSVNVFGVPGPPVLGSNSPLCTGLSLSLTAATVPGAVYSWSGPNSFSSNVQNPVLTNITALNAGTYSAAVSVAGCGGASNTLAIVVNPTPATPLAVSNSPVCAGQNLTFSANSTSGGSYTWLSPLGASVSAQAFTITAATTTASGLYSVVTVVNSCTSAAGTISVTVNPIPATPTVASNSPLCAGQNLSLTTSSGANSYSWTGPNSFASAAQNPVIVGTGTNASGTYSVTQTIAGCSSAEGTVAVVVNPIPVPPVINSNAPLCALRTLSLTAASGAASYNWQGPSGFTSSAQNPTIANVPVTASGTYSATQTMLGCTSPAATMTVLVNPAAPSPTAASNSPLCIGQNILFNQLPIAGASYTWTGPAGFTASVQNPSIASAGTVASGNYSVFAQVAGCPGPTVTLNVSVTMPATLVVGSTQTVCANNSAVNLNASSTTGSGVWVSSGTGTFAPNTPTGTYFPSPADIISGGVTMTITSTNNGGCASTSTTLDVIITPAPTSSAGTNTTVCANNASVALSGSVTIASGGVWSSSGTGTFSPNTTALSATYMPSAADISAGTFTITLTTSGNGNCLPVSSDKIITISPAPVVVPGPSVQVVCKSNPNFQLNGSSTTGSGSWLSSGTGSFSSVNVLNPTYFPSTPDTTAGFVTLTLTSTNNGGCLAVSQTMTLLYVSTIAVNAGSNQIICSNAPIILNGVSTTSAGIWTSNGTGAFTPSNAPLSSTYTPSAADILAGNLNFTLTTANNGGCLPLTSFMNVTITPGPTSSAGSNQTVCANNATTSLSGSFSIASGAIWSSSGTGTFFPSTTSLNVSYFASAADTTAGSVVITLSTTGNGSCSASTSTMLLSFSPAPLVVAGGTLGVCKNNALAQLNGYSSTGSGTWTSLGTGTLSANNILNPTYSPSTADTSAGFVKLILTSINNGGCLSVSDTLRIVYSAPPVLSMVSSNTICANNASVVLTGSSTTGSGSWISGGDGSFSPNGINGTYFAGPNDIISGIVSLTLSSTNNGGCIPASLQNTIYITPAPVTNAGTDQNICANSPTAQLNGSCSIATGVIWTSVGTGTFAASTQGNTQYFASSADVGNGSVKLVLTSTGNGNCLAVTDTMLLSFIAAPVADAGSDLNACPNTAGIALSGTSTTGSYSWSSPGGGSFVPGANIANPSYQPSAAEKTAGNALLILNTGLGNCGSDADTMKIVFKSQSQAAFTYTNACAGAATSFSDQSVSTGTDLVNSWLWKFDNDTSTKRHPQYTFAGIGFHQVKQIVSNGICADSITKTIHVHALPVVKFSYTIKGNDSVFFAQTSTISTGVIKGYDWNFGDGGNSTLRSPLHVYADSGFYQVKLLIRSDSGCTASETDTIYIMHDDLVLIFDPAVPGAFTPNGDGSNDVLLVRGGPFNKIDFRVFNEWGAEIFQSSDATKGWDGIYRDAPQPVGRFIWTLTCELINGKTFKMAGEVFLHR